MDTGIERSRRVARNAAALVFSNVAGAIVSFAVVPVTLAGLGTDGYGILQTMVSLGGLVAVGDLGLGFAVGTEVAKHAGGGRKDAIRDLIGEAIVALTLLAVLVVSVVAVAASRVDVGAFFRLPSHLRAQGVNAFAAATLAFAARMPLSVFTSAQSGLQITHRLVLWTTGGNTLASLAGAVAAIATHRVDVALGAQLTVAVTANAVVAVLGCRIDPASVPRLRVPPVAAMVALVRKGLGYYVVGLGTQIIGGIDNLVIARIAGPQAVACYAVAHRLITFGYNMVYSIAASFWSGAAHALGARDGPWILREGARARRAGTLLMTLLASGYVAAAPTVITLWTRGRIEIDPWLLLGLGTYFLVNGHAMIDGALVMATGSLRGMMAIVGLEAAVNLGASIWLGRRLGYVGVGLGTLVANALCYFVPIQLLSARLLAAGPGGVTSRPRIWTRDLTAGIVAVASSFALRALVTPRVDVHRLILLGILGSLAVAVAAVAIAGIGGRDSFAVLRGLVATSLDRIKRRLGRGSAPAA